MIRKTLEFINSKLVFTVLLLIFIGLLWLQFEQWRERRSINREISELQKQEQLLQQQNQQLEQSLKFFASDAYKEQVARQQLGLQKEGEIAINFPKPGELLPEVTADPTVQKSNPHKWWSFLFLN